MNVGLPAGHYVIAVSGGVDSVALLDMLAQDPELQLTVAHFDHGIREDSGQDREYVRALAASYGLPYVYCQGRLGAQASEATARAARYKFLHATRQHRGADAIVTAHHQDDVLETIILNLLRGTGRRGLSSLRSGDVVLRPLLEVPKKELLRYASEQGLRWREDSTNADTRYLRNYIRRYLLPRFAESDREQLLALSQHTAALNDLIARGTSDYLHLQPAARTLDRHQFVMLPHNVAREVLAEWLRIHTDVELSRRMLERLTQVAKTGRSGSKVDVSGDFWLEIGRTQLALTPRER
jgi:tRNA(Ile)-lysidine synthase